VFAALSAPDIHKPWMLSAEALKAASHTLKKKVTAARLSIIGKRGHGR
jgi:uncharacterized protein YndB with AHSA1/START domain